ncbi:MAG: NUDIX domain-containing protein [Candidatus Diapherotrites archaeon]|nr:NUDIX domain-containing protein [Candidatus Diapherotrites archaeon]
MDNQKMHYVVATGIVIKEGKYLIAKRADWEKAFPGRWTVPGGKLESKEYTEREKDASELWYNIVEGLVEREVKEEVGLEIENQKYLTSLSYIRPDGMPCIIISMFADWKNGEVKLCNALTEHAWVSLEEAREYDLIDGIFDELRMLDEFLKENKTHAGKWEKK